MAEMITTIKVELSDELKAYMDKTIAAVESFNVENIKADLKVEIVAEISRDYTFRNSG